VAEERFMLPKHHGLCASDQRLSEGLSLQGGASEGSHSGLKDFEGLKVRKSRERAWSQVRKSDGSI
jgi:hypothetical protein